MKRRIILAFLIVGLASLVSGFILSRTSKNMELRIHAKDLSKEGLVFILPSDRKFDFRIVGAKGAPPHGVKEDLRPFTVLLENQTDRAVVAYTIRWCLSGSEGLKRCYTNSYSSPLALMEGEKLPPDDEARTKNIPPHSTILVSVISDSDEIQIGPPEKTSLAEWNDKKGKARLGDDLKAQAKRALSKYTDLTVILDGAFFDNGVFVGEDSTEFFSQIKSQIDARQDLLSDLAAKAKNPGVDKTAVFADLERIGNQEAPRRTKSTPEDRYRYFSKYYAQEILRARNKLGAEKALAEALRATTKPWPMLVKKSQ